MERNRRGARPSVEGLEGRMLLNASKGHAAHVRAEATPSTAAAGRQINYTAADGARVRVTLQGPGTLKGSTVSGGVLNLVYSGTNLKSGITGTVKGGSGEAPLGSIRDANVPLGSTTGLGGELIARVELANFDLISGGTINLLGGVDVLTLNSAAANSQIRLRDTPLVTTSSTTTSSTASSSFGAGNAAAGFGSNNNAGLGATTGSLGGSPTGVGSVSTGNQNVSGAGTLNPTISGFGGAAVGATSGKIAMIPTVGNGQNFPGTPGLTQAQVSSGRSLTYATNAAGGVALTGIAGTFTPGPNLIEPRDISKPGPAPAPPGVIVTIKHIGGGPTALSPPLGDAQIYGLDTRANALIRFDAATGAALQSIPLPASGTDFAGVALARAGARQVVLVGVNQQVLAFDAATGAPAGRFSTVGLIPNGLTTIDGIGTAGQATVLVDSIDGKAQAVDVAQSLAFGQAVTIGSPFTAAREFLLSGGATGVPGTDNLYAQGGAHFDTFQPNLDQAGFLTINTAGNRLAESARVALISQGTFVPAAASGLIRGNPTAALGSLDSSLALDTGVRNGRNVIALLSPVGLTNQGSFVLNDANPLADLSESFHPELAGTALVDVQGNVQSFTARTADGLVLNDAGNLDQLSIRNARNSSIVALPFGHVNIAVRNNVSIVTSSRLVGTRGDVTIVPTQRQVGPLTLPG